MLSVPPSLTLVSRSLERAREGDRVVVVRDGETAARGRRRDGRGRRAEPRRARERAIPVAIAEVLGPSGNPEADHRALVWKYGLPGRFTRRARLEADALPDALPGEELARRLDLRHLPFVTIDPGSARDHDDALFAEAGPGGALAAWVGWRAQTSFEAASHAWLAGALATFAVAFIRVPFHVYWRGDAALLAQLPLEGGNIALGKPRRARQRQQHGADAGKLGIDRPGQSFRALLELELGLFSLARRVAMQQNTAEDQRGYCGR